VNRVERRVVYRGCSQVSQVAGLSGGELRSRISSSGEITLAPWDV
jgi:hypothetical protein